MTITKTQKQMIIDKMIETIKYIRDAEKNADAFYSADTIRMNMSNYFTGLAFALESITGEEYHYSARLDENNNVIWSLVTIKNGNEIYYQID